MALLTHFQTSRYAYTFDPYGRPTLTGGNGVGQNPYLFKGGIQDRATGFVKFGGRWYDPTTGRWTQQDTLDAPLDPANANRYMFAGDDPINNGDPTGKDWATDLVCAGSAVTTIVLGLGLAGFTIGEAPTLGADTPATAGDYLLFAASAAIAVGSCSNLS